MEGVDAFRVGDGFVGCGDAGGGGEGGDSFHGDRRTTKSCWLRWDQVGIVRRRSQTEVGRSGLDGQNSGLLSGYVWPSPRHNPAYYLTLPSSDHCFRHQDFCRYDV